MALHRCLPSHAAGRARHVDSTHYSAWSPTPKPTRLLVRDHEHHLQVMPFDDVTITQPLHLSLPPRRRSHPPPTTFLSSPSPPTHPHHPLHTLPLDTLLLITSYLPPPTLPLLLTLSTPSHHTFRHPLLWRQLALSLSYLPPPLPLSSPLPWRSFTIAHHSALTRSSLLLHHLHHHLAPSRYRQLRPGLTPLELLRCEEAMGRGWPEEVRGWLRVVDGEEGGGETPVGCGLVEGCRVLSGEEMVREGRVEGMGREWLAVTEWSGIHRVLLHMTEGSVWLVTGSIGDMHRLADSWLDLLFNLFPRAHF